MSAYYYQLRIDTDPQNWDSLNSILSVEGNQESGTWMHEVVQGESDDYFDFVDFYLNKLENGFVKLEEIGVTKDCISLWVLYEYADQCNMEFRPNDLKRIGDSELSLCVTCWEA